MLKNLCLNRTFFFFHLLLLLMGQSSETKHHKGPKGKLKKRYGSKPKQTLNRTRRPKNPRPQTQHPKPTRLSPCTCRPVNRTKTRVGLITDEEHVLTTPPSPMYRDSSPEPPVFTEDTPERTPHHESTDPNETSSNGDQTPPSNPPNP